MARPRLSIEARRDFDDIIDYLKAVAGSRVAAKYARNIRAAINRLTDFPGLGTPRPELGDATRVLVVDPYLIFYDGGPDSRAVLVLRILHGRRNIDAEMIAHGRER